MTTLATNLSRLFEMSHRNSFPMIATDIIYEGAAVGIVTATGHARPLVAGDRFAGFAEEKADNARGAAAAINVRVIESGKIELAVSGAVITDVGQPVYATDDNAFTLVSTAAVFIGFVHRFVSSGVVIVAFDAPLASRIVAQTAADLAASVTAAALISTLGGEADIDFAASNLHVKRAFIVGVTAPTDGALAANQAAIWFDPTNGAAKLMIKAKQADGTVKTGAIDVQT